MAVVYFLQDIFKNVFVPNLKRLIWYNPGYQDTGLDGWNWFPNGWSIRDILVHTREPRLNKLNNGFQHSQVNHFKLLLSYIENMSYNNLMRIMTF